MLSSGPLDLLLSAIYPVVPTHLVRFLLALNSVKN